MLVSYPCRTLRTQAGLNYKIETTVTPSSSLRSRGAKGAEVDLIIFLFYTDAFSFFL